MKLFRMGATTALIMSLMIATGAAIAQDRAVIDPTVILGSRELPKVLYIVPWKKPVPGDLSGRPMVSVVEEALAPLDRDVFARQVQYRAQQQARLQASAQAAAQAPPPAQAADAADVAAKPAPAASSP
jgi:hypothetical protein